MKEELRQCLYRLLTWALTEAGIGARDYEPLTDRGDGVLVLLHPADDFSRPFVPDRFIPALASLLAAHNSATPAAEPLRRLRLRVAIHAGEVCYHNKGFTGEDLDVAFRLLDAPRFKVHLQSTGESLALIASDEIYQSVFCRGNGGIASEEFCPLETETIGGQPMRGWVRLPLGIALAANLQRAGYSVQLTGLRQAPVRRAEGVPQTSQCRPCMDRQIANRNEQQIAPALTARQEPPDFRILGALQMTAGGQPQETGPEKEQRLLVALLSERGMPVTYERLIEAIWDDMPKRGSLDALHHLMSWLHKRLAAIGADGVLTAASSTYQLDIPAAHVDVHRFRDLTARASELAGDDRRVIALLEEALRLHQGEPLAGLRGRWIGAYRHRLLEERRTAELALCEAAIRAGESRERIDKLHSLFRDRPRDEWAAWLYMHALYRAGRWRDALRVWHTATRHLDDLTATASLRALSDLHERILRQDDDLLRPEAVKFPGGEAGMRARGVFRGDMSAAAAVFGMQVNHHEPQ